MAGCLAVAERKRTGRVETKIRAGNTIRYYLESKHCARRAVELIHRNTLPPVRFCFATARRTPSKGRICTRTGLIIILPLGGVPA